jgi:hypothetical protein
MNELERMCADVSPPDESVVAEGYRRLLAATRRGDEAARSRHRSRSHRPRPWQVVAPAGLVTAVAVGVVVAQSIGDHPPTSPHNIKNVSASEVLHHAAAAARTEPELHPRADQYIYVRSKDAWGPGLSHPGLPKGGDTRQVWLSVDGSKPGLLREPCGANPARLCDTPLVNADAPQAQPTPAPGSYLWNLQNIPRRIRSLRAEVSRPVPHPTEPPGKQAWEEIRDDLVESYLPPKLRAQIFDFLAEVPGIKVERNVTDASGRPGIAVTTTMYNTRSELIFDPGSYRFLGSREIYLGPVAVESASRVPDWSRPPPGSNFDRAYSIVQVKVVDHLPTKT